MQLDTDQGVSFSFFFSEFYPSLYLFLKTLPSLWSVAGNLMDMSSQLKTQVAPQLSALIYGTSPQVFPSYIS